MFWKTTVPNEQNEQDEALREMLSKVRRIEIRSRRAVNQVLAGEYHSVFKGRGMEFDEVREYMPGDEIRDIDWNVTARTGKPFVKRYVEEREQTVFFLVDLSASGLFGSGDRLKSEVVAEICAVLAFSAIKNQDRVGLMTFTDEVEQHIPAQKGSKHVLRVIRELLFAKPRGRKTDIAHALDSVNRVLKRRAIIFLVSDFLSDDFRKPLMVTNRRHDLTALHIRDGREEELPAAGIVELEDAETGESRLVDCSEKKVREFYASTNQQRLLELERLFRSLGVDQVPLRVEQDYIEALVKFFRLRAKRL